MTNLFLVQLSCPTVPPHDAIINVGKMRGVTPTDTNNYYIQSWLGLLGVVRLV